MLPVEVAWGPQGENGYSGVPPNDRPQIDVVADLAKSRIDECVFGDWQPPAFAADGGKIQLTRLSPPNGEGMPSNG